MDTCKTIQGVILSLVAAVAIVATAPKPVQSQEGDIEYCNYKTFYQCPSCYDTPPYWSIRNASAALPIYLCDIRGDQPCATGTSIQCIGDLYDAPCGFAGNFIGTGNDFGADSCKLP